MDGFKHTIPISMQTIDADSGTIQNTQEVRFGLMPPKPGTCEVCAVKHEPHLFHDCRSLFYQYAFYGRQRRWPTWADATAHCPPEIIATLKEVLASNKLKWSEPPAGVAVIPHLGETEAQPERGHTPVPDDALLQPGADLEITHEEGNYTKRPAKVLAVVPKGVPVEHAIADQNGQPRPLMVDRPSHKQTLYVLEEQQPDGSKRRLYVPHRKFKKGIAAGSKLDGAA